MGGIFVASKSDCVMDLFWNRLSLSSWNQTRRNGSIWEEYGL